MTTETRPSGDEMRRGLEAARQRMRDAAKAGETSIDVLATCAVDGFFSASGSAAQPVKMILFCPNCGIQHIDAPDERTPDWQNPPHRSHLCHGCGHIWRPADVATEGVKAIETRGKADHDLPWAVPAQPVGAMGEEAPKSVDWMWCYENPKDAAAEIERLTDLVKGYEEWGDDVKRLTRELDVEMHGAGAAKQASLCDLIGCHTRIIRELEAAQGTGPYPTLALANLLASLRVTRKGVDELQDQRIALENIDGMIANVQALLAAAPQPPAPKSDGEREVIDAALKLYEDAAVGAPQNRRASLNYGIDVKAHLWAALSLAIERLPQPPQPISTEGSTSEEDWIEWEGGEQPVPNGTTVEVLLRVVGRARDKAEAFDWKHSKTGELTGGSDIIAYRVVKEG